MRDRENGFGMKKEEKAWKVERDKVDHDQTENKKADKNKQQQPQDLRGFFQCGALESEKKGVRQARERLEQVEVREQGMTTLIQLKKRQPGSGEKEKVEPSSNVEAQKTEVSVVEPSSNIEVQKTEVSGGGVSLIQAFWPNPGTPQLRLDVPGLGLGVLEWSLWWPPRTTSAQVHCGQVQVHLCFASVYLDLALVDLSRVGGRRPRATLAEVAQVKSRSNSSSPRWT